MLKTVPLAAVALLGLLSTGCAVSLHPVHSKDVLVGDPSLEGDWVSIHPNNAKPTGHVYEITKATAPGHYDVNVVHEDKDEYVLWEVRLIKLGKHLYADVIAAEYQTKPESLSFFVLPMHSTFRVRLAGDRLTLLHMPMGVIKAFAEKDGIKTLHRDANPDHFILLSETKRLQEFLIKHEDKLAIDNQPLLVLQRRKPDEKPRGKKKAE